MQVSSTILKGFFLNEFYKIMLILSNYSFIMFSLLFLIMSIAWFFFIMSWVRYDGLLYTHVVVNALQAPLIFYVCVIKQKHVTFLLKKSCCYNEPAAVTDWGDELTYMNGGDY